MEQAPISQMTPTQADLYTNAHGLKFSPVCFTVVAGVTFSSNVQELPIEQSLKPFGLNAALRILRFISGLLATDSASTMPMHRKMETKFLGLSLLNAIFDVAALAILDWPDLLSFIQKELTCNLLQLLHVSQMAVLSLTLRVLQTAFFYYTPLLKAHMEAFLVTLLRMASDSKASQQYEITELILETLLGIFKQPQFLLELYANYDCDVYCTNLFKNAADYLYKCVTPKAQSALCSLQMLALESMLAILSCFPRYTHSLYVITMRSFLVTEPGEPSSVAQRLRLEKQKKTMLSTAAELFNKSPKVICYCCYIWRYQA